MPRTFLLIWMLVMILISAEHALADYSICGNKSTGFAGSQTEMKMNGTNSYIFLDDTLGSLNWTSNLSKENYIGIWELQAGVSESLSAFAINRSAPRLVDVWVAEIGIDTFYRVNLSGNVTMNVSYDALGIGNVGGMDTLDGETFYVAETTTDNIWIVENNFTRARLCGRGADLGSGISEITINGSGGKVNGFWVQEATSGNIMYLDSQCNVLKRHDYNYTQRKDLQLLATYDNVTIGTYDQSDDVFRNFTDDSIPPSLVGVRVNDTRFISGSTVNLSFDVNDNCH